MFADVEKPDGTYVKTDMGEPVCGRDFCDGCGDCLHCQYHSGVDWCNAGSESWWVIYIDNPINPFYMAKV